jgi:hypothetical protein
MQNGYQIDPQTLMLQTLLDLKESNGRIEQRLDDGKEFHHEVRQTLKEHRETLNAHGRQIVMLHRNKRRSSFWTVMELFKVVKEIWPLLFLITTIATAVGVHVPSWVNELSQHSVSGNE